MIRVHSEAFRPVAFAAGGLAALVLSTGIAAAQTYGFATMQPGTLNHTSASAVAKVLKEKAGANVVVQPTAGESVMIPLVSRGEAEFGPRAGGRSHDVAYIPGSVAACDDGRRSGHDRSQGARKIANGVRRTGGDVESAQR